MQVPVFQPTNMRIQKAKGLTGGTNASPLWHCQIIGSAPMNLGLVNSPWVNSIVGSVEAFCHAIGGTLEVRRFMTKSAGLLVGINGVKTPFSATFEDKENADCALGFTLDSDGLKITMQEWDSDSSLTPEVLPAILASWFTQVIEENTELGDCSIWLRTWLRVVAIGAMSKTSHAHSLVQAWEELISDPNLSIIKQTSQDILGDIPGEPQPQVLADVLDAFDDPSVIKAIGQCVGQVDAKNPGFLKFARRRYLSTVAGAFLEAMLHQMPSMTADDVIVDVEAFDGTEDFSFWISESEAGSSGIVEGFLNVYQADPQMFWNSFERALDPTDLETLDAKVADSLDLALSEPTVQSAFANVRASLSADLEVYKNAVAELFRLLERSEIMVDHSVSVALTNRLLSAGTTPAHDQTRKDLRDNWIAEELRLGIEIDMRSIASKWAGLSKYDNLIGYQNIPSCERHGFFESLLWPRGGQVRELELELPNMFQNPPKPDRLLVPRPHTSSLHVSVGRDLIDAALVSNGEVTIWAAMNERTALAKLMKDFAVVPTDAGFLNVHPRMTSFVNRGDKFECRLELVEVI
jgi:hypothetical protein